jgi:hypothetical protein
MCATYPVCRTVPHRSHTMLIQTPISDLLFSHSSCLTAETDRSASITFCTVYASCITVITTQLRSTTDVNKWMIEIRVYTRNEREFVSVTKYESTLHSTSVASRLLLTWNLLRTFIETHVIFTSIQHSEVIVSSDRILSPIFSNGNKFCFFKLTIKLTILF